MTTTRPAGNACDADAPDGESEKERLTRNFNELLQELRVSQTGVQILTGFLLTMPFTNKFGTLDPFQRDGYLVTLCGAVLATALIIAPAAFHRTLFRRGEKAWVVAARRPQRPRRPVRPRVHGLRCGVARLRRGQEPADRSRRRQRGPGPVRAALGRVPPDQARRGLGGPPPRHRGFRPGSRKNARCSSVGAGGGAPIDRIGGSCLKDVTRSREPGLALALVAVSVLAAVGTVIAALVSGPGPLPRSRAAEPAGDTARPAGWSRRRPSRRADRGRGPRWRRRAADAPARLPPAWTV